MKKVLIILIALALTTLLAIWSPWLNWNVDFAALAGLKPAELNSGIQVYSLSGELEVRIDDVVIGKVKPEDSPLIYDKIIPGEHLLTLKKVSENESNYWQLKRVMTFEPSTNVVASFNLGPEEEFSEGHIIYSVPKTGSSTKLNLNTNIAEPSVKINDLMLEGSAENTFTTQLSLDQQHRITISKADYESLEFIILPSKQEDRDKLKSYDLNIDIHLMLQPVNVE
jgi:hypothetical protein